MSRGVYRSATMAGEEKVSLRPGGSSATMASMLSGMSLRPGGGGGAMSLKPGGASALSSFAKGAGAGLKPKAPPVEAKPAKPEWERIKYTVPFLRKFQEVRARRGRRRAPAADGPARLPQPTPHARRCILRVAGGWRRPRAPARPPRPPRSRRLLAGRHRRGG